MLTLGTAVGLVRLLVRDERLDALIAVTAATWLVWCAYLGLRLLGSWTGRRAAYLALAGFALVIVVRLALPGHPLRLMLRLVLVGTSHHHAPVELREQVALDRDDAQALTARLAEAEREAVCLSTCNRTELYLAADDAEQAEQRRGRRPRRRSGRRSSPRCTGCRTVLPRYHLFRVAAGLDSLVPGEGEILGQVRVAHELGTTGPLLDRVFRQALHAGRKVRAQTAIGESPASVSSAAAALAEQVFGSLDGRSILLLGAGKVSEQAARNLRSRGAAIALVANSKTDRERIDEELARVDVVIASTNAPGLVLDAATVAAVLRGRRGRQLLLVDLAVPRDLDPAIRDLDGCYLYDIDDLEQIVDRDAFGPPPRSRAGRVDRRGEAEKFHEWHASLDVVPAIASLRARPRRSARPSCRRPTRSSGGSTTASGRPSKSVTAQIVNKLLHLPTVRMKQAAAAADGCLC